MHDTCVSKGEAILNSSKVRQVLINKTLVAKVVIVKVSQNLNLMQRSSTQWSQQRIRYVFSRIIECFEQNLWKQIDCKRP